MTEMLLPKSSRSRVVPCDHILVRPRAGTIGRHLPGKLDVEAESLPPTPLVPDVAESLKPAYSRGVRMVQAVLDSQYSKTVGRWVLVHNDPYEKYKILARGGGLVPLL